MLCTVHDIELFELSLFNFQLLRLAAKYNKTPAQIALRYQIERGHTAVPKSANKKRLAENIGVFDFQLNEEEMKSLNELNQNRRYFANDV